MPAAMTRWRWGPPRLSPVGSPGETAGDPTMSGAIRDAAPASVSANADDGPRPVLDHADRPAVVVTTDGAAAVLGHRLVPAVDPGPVHEARQARHGTRVLDEDGRAQAAPLAGIGRPLEQLPA